jgi:hypothetical protein
MVEASAPGYDRVLGQAPYRLALGASMSRRPRSVHSGWRSRYRQSGPDQRRRGARHGRGERARSRHLADDWAHTGPQVEPRATHAAVCERLYAVFSRLYPEVARLMHELAAVERDALPTPGAAP